MVTKLIIVCLCMVCSTMIGLSVTNSKKRRVCYLESCVKLTDKLIADISFRHDNLTNILKEFAATDKSELSADLYRFCDSPYGEFTTNYKAVKNTEKQLLTEFFSSLGTADTQTQLLCLQNYKNRFNAIYTEESDKFKKNGKIVIKLSVLLGLAIGILIL